VPVTGATGTKTGENCGELLGGADGSTIGTEPGAVSLEGKTVIREAAGWRLGLGVGATLRC